MYIKQRERFVQSIFKIKLNQFHFYIAEPLCDKIDFFSAHSKFSSLCAPVIKVSTVWWNVISYPIWMAKLN